jgi:hypothetical protein
MEMLTMSVPAAVGDRLVDDGLATRPLDSRGLSEGVQLVVAATGFVANSMTVVVSVVALRTVWRTIIKSLRRQRRAERVRIQIGDYADISLDLEWLADHQGEAEKVILSSIGRSLVEIADSDR